MGLCHSVPYIHHVPMCLLQCVFLKPEQRSMWRLQLVPNAVPYIMPEDHLPESMTQIHRYSKRKHPSGGLSTSLQEGESWRRFLKSFQTFKSPYKCLKIVPMGCGPFQGTVSSPNLLHLKYLKGTNFLH